MKKFAVILVLVSVLFLHIQAVSAESLGINAQSCILIESKTGQVLYWQNADEKKVFPASTTKIMTAIIALERGDLNQLMTASEAAVYDIGKDGMNIGIMPGEQIPMENLLEALLIRSANEAANIIAENISSTREEFVKLMNEKALELGAVNTNFINPCGQHDDNHYTTAEDLAKIARYAMTLPKFREIVAKKEFTMPPTNKHSTWPVLANTNDLLKYYSNEKYTVNGIKTGYTDPAGQCLVFSAVNNEGIELIGVVLGVRGADARKNVFKYSAQLLDYGFDNFAMQTVISRGETVKTGIPVAGAKDNATVTLVSQSDLSCLLPLDKSKWDIEIKETIKPKLEAPINRGEVLGTLEYIRGGVSIGKVNLVAATDIEMNPVGIVTETVENLSESSTFKNVLSVVLIVLGTFILLRTTLRIISRRLKARRYLR